MLDLDIDLDPSSATALATLALPNSPLQTAQQALSGAASHSHGTLQPADLPPEQHAAADTAGSTLPSPSADPQSTGVLSTEQGCALPVADTGSCPDAHSSAASQPAVDTASGMHMPDQQDLVGGQPASGVDAMLMPPDNPDLGMTNQMGPQHTGEGDPVPVSSSGSSSALLQSVTTEELYSDCGFASEVSTEQDLGSPASDVEQLPSPVSRVPTDSQTAGYSTGPASPSSPADLGSPSEPAGQQMHRPHCINHS